MTTAVLNDNTSEIALGAALLREFPDWDPLQLYNFCWPNWVLYDKQIDIIYSVVNNDKTVAVAGNQLGKDFITAFIVLWFFLSRTPCRVVTTSSTDKQLMQVLWTEMSNFINSSKYPLPLQVNHGHIRQLDKEGGFIDKSYIIAIVPDRPEPLQGHHLARPDGRPYTMSVSDEASGTETAYHDAMDTWAHRDLTIGNPLPCANFFFDAVEKGSIKKDDDDNYHLKIIQIKATDSPNVRLAIAQKEAGLAITRETVVPGVLDYDTYLSHRKLWDPVRQTIGLDAEFYKGAEILLYPPQWLNRAHEFARQLNGSERQAITLGVDSGQGVANTCWSVCDYKGLMFQQSKKTTDTMEIPSITIALMKQYGIMPENILFDSGGGGTQHANYMRRLGYNVRAIGFGEGATLNPDYQTLFTVGNTKKRVAGETRYSFKNRRAEMYGILRFQLLDPSTNTKGFGIPEEYTELRRQLSPLPLLYDGEGRLYLPPKNKTTKDSTVKSLTEMLGCSPDESDSLVLAVFGLFNKAPKNIVGAL